MVAAFFFQNNVIPLSQVKMYTLLYSMRQKSPELDIPEQIFYREIAGYNIYVKKKTKNGLLKNLMIYDYSQGFNNAQVIVADSGRLKMSVDKLYLILSLYSGEAFENLTDQGNARSNDAVPYRTETFQTKDILMKFDANFNRANESIMQDRYVGKNLADLQKSIDTMTYTIDSIKNVHATMVYNQSYKKSLNRSRYDTIQTPDEIPNTQLDFDEIYNSKSAGTKLTLLQQTKSALETIKADYGFKAIVLANDEKEMRRHHTEMHKKFTLSFACLIFFFIGAPLGAIIRKGGLGMPVIISVLLFIVYYIIDNVGFKMSTNGMWKPWQGMWLASGVLLPLGMFLTHKAVNDSVILDMDTYVDAVKKWLGVRYGRIIQKKEVVMVHVDSQQLITQLQLLQQLAINYISEYQHFVGYRNFWKTQGENTKLKQINQLMESIVDYAANSQSILVINKLMDLPIINDFQFDKLPLSKKICTVIAWTVPLGALGFLIAKLRHKAILNDINTVNHVARELENILK
jgi:lipopolysaccharide export system permease protein